MKHTVVSGFADLAPRFVEAWEKPNLHGFDHSLVWFRTIAPLFCSEKTRLRIICVEDESGAPRAVLPLVCELQRVGPLRHHYLRSMSNFYSALFGPVFFSADNTDEVSAELVAGVVAMRDWAALDLSPLELENGTAARLAAAMKREGLFVHPYFRFGNWYLTVGGRDFEEYRQSRPTRLRDTERRKRRRLNKNYKVEIEVITGGDRLERALDDFAEVYALSWKRAEPYPAFIRNVALEFAQRGWLRLGIIRLDGEAVAVQIWFVCGDTASIFKLAHNRKHDSLSVGSILTMHLMRHVIDVDGVEEVDFLAGDDPYKDHWMSARRQRVGLRIYRPGTLVGSAGIIQSKVSQALNRRRVIDLGEA